MMPQNAATPQQPHSDQDSAADAFRAKMRETLGIDPGSIKWDGEVHRFPGKDKKRRNDAGWYCAFPDGARGVFGDHSQGISDKGIDWQLKRDMPVTPEQRAEWAREKKRRKAAKIAAQERAAEECGAAWEAASPATRGGHPYLTAKKLSRHIKDVRILKAGTKGLRILGGPYTVKEDTLLIPMWAKARRLANLQRINSEGKKFWPSAEVVGLYLIVGAKLFDRKNPLIYLCEGWATAWSVSGCAEATAVVAFNTGGLLPVAKRIRDKYTDLRLIIAADNDRWTSLSDDTPNPGVWYATKAAEEVGADVAIPDFKDLSGKPTDFNDLHRLEGPKAVRKWLDPASAGSALTAPADAAPAEEAPAEEAEASTFEQWNELENLSDWIANGIIAAMPGLAAVYNEAKVVGWNQYTEELGWTQTAHHDLLRRAYHIVRSVSTPRQKYGPVEADGITVLSRKRRVRATVQGDWNASEAYLPLQGSPRGVELRTGKVVTVPAEELMTHRVNVSEKSYRSGEDWRGGFWEECLYEWLDDDPDTIQTIQQTLGQALMR